MFHLNKPGLILASQLNRRLVWESPRPCCRDYLKAMVQDAEPEISRCILRITLQPCAVSCDPRRLKSMLFQTSTQCGAVSSTLYYPRPRATASCNAGRIHTTTTCSNSLPHETREGAHGHLLRLFVQEWQWYYRLCCFCLLKYRKVLVWSR